MVAADYDAWRPVRQITGVRPMWIPTVVAVPGTRGFEISVSAAATSNITGDQIVAPAANYAAVTLPLAVKLIVRVAGGGSNAEADVAMATFREGMPDLGYVEGLDIVIEERFASAADRPSFFATELHHIQPEVVLVSTSMVALAGAAVVSTIPS
jgi:hypothetical protein